MPVNRRTNEYGGRFAVDPAGSSILTGYQQASDRLDRDLIRRNLKPYAEHGMTQSLKALRGMSDQDIRDMATKAVLSKNEVGKKKAKPKAKKPATGGGGKKATKPKAAPKPRVVTKPVRKPKIKVYRPKPTKPKYQPPPPKPQRKPPKEAPRKPPKQAKPATVGGKAPIRL